MERIGAKTGVIGIPFHSNESRDTLNATLNMIARSLPENCNVPIIVCQNGPDSQRIVSIEEYLGKLNLTIVRSPEGIVYALTRIVKEIKALNPPFCIFYDTDISPLPNWFRELTSSDLTRCDCVLTHHSPYPPEILVTEGRVLPETSEYFVVRITEGDKHPLIQEAIRVLSGSGRLLKAQSKPRIKGSLLRINPNLVNFGGQKITSDSVLGFILDGKIPWTKAKTGFFYMPRTSLEDYLRARLRHFRALESLWGINAVTASESLYPEQDLNIIRDFVLSENGGAGREVVAFFLLRENLRRRSLEILKNFINCHKRITQEMEFPGQRQPEVLLEEVNNFLNGPLTPNDALYTIDRILNSVDWSSVVNSRVSSGLGITQINSSRTPIDLGPYLENETTRRILYSWLNLE